jgi:phosphoadenosine phosphosulfate reductase
MIVSQPSSLLALDAATLPKAGPELDAINQQLETLSLTDFLRWSVAVFGDRVAHVTSFGPSGVVILDHLLRLKPNARVLTLDTDFLFTETYELFDRIERRYAIGIEVVRPALSPAEQERQYGANLWELEPDICCDLRKVQPLGRALAGLDAWYTGIRRDQGGTRTEVPLVGWDLRYNVFKLSPLAGWTRAQVWQYIRDHDVPYNTLHDQGYTSIGCTHCTRPPANAGDERSGRWAGKQKTECGLHWAPPAAKGGCPA